MRSARRHVLLLAVALVTVAAPACGPAASPGAMPASGTPASAAPASVTRPPATFAETLAALCTGPASVPMEIAGSREFVQVRIPGAKSDAPLRFHVDSGGNTPGLVLRRSVAERLGFTSAQAMPRTVRIADRDVALPAGASWYLMNDADDAVTFEDMTRRDFSVGQIGAGFLSRFAVCVDPGSGRLGLGDPHMLDAAPAGVPWVPLFFRSGGAQQALYPFVHVLLLDRGAFAGGYGMLVDTGATTSMIDQNKIDYQHGKHPDWPFVNGAFGDADMIGSTKEQLLLAPEVAFHSPGGPGDFGLAQPVTIPAGPARFVSRPTGTWRNMFGDVQVTMGSHGALANDVLLRYRLVLDYSHARLFVEPSAAPSAATAGSAASSRVGVSVRFDRAGCPEVEHLTDTNAPETIAALHEHDVIHTIDGANACEMYHHQLSAALAGPPGTIKKLRVQRDGAEKDIDVKTAELLVARP